MAKRLLFIVLAMSAFTAQANTIYKCMMDEKVVFSQTVCPQEYRQHKIEYQLGITTEVDSDKREIKQDPLKALLNKQTISKEKLLQLLDGEMYRLKQENSYFEILRASEIQKLDRKRFWQTKPKDDPSYGLELQEINTRFNDLTNNNIDVIQILNQHKMKISAETQPDEYMSN
ncbi:DUF4124 domain-containing protein [Shewanella livingstonensis]|uniref:DUF4124 domain-containing protein n=1 Tax=Shewanella livingstonensis TaxID=150120 RepID=A0A3G8M0F7_9GAMM|nr:DUF4124 domain-containing protein [Shewanella livingstonensis]AZG74602.1 DUF4124 domain-containing protein [Shewanella livingstonensis]